MDEILFLLYGGTLLSSLFAAAFAIIYFAGRKEELVSVARRLFYLSAFLQSLFIAGRFFLVGHTPITSPFEALFFFAWSTSFAFVSFQWRYEVKNFGAFAAPFITLLLWATILTSRDIIILSPQLQSFWLPVHAGIAIFSYGFLALAFCGSLMYLIMERELKRKRLGFFFERLPSLESLDQLNNHCITIGFALLTVGLLTGVLWMKQVFGVYWKGGSKEVWSLIIWCALLVQIHQRHSVGWRGKRAAWMTLTLFVAILLTLFGVSYIFDGGVHGHAV